MPIKEIYEKLILIDRPFKIFGGSKIEDVKLEYRKLAKRYHPDLLEEKDKEFGEKIIDILNKMYKLALKEIDEGIYETFDLKILYKTKKAIIEFKIGTNEYKFYEYLSDSDIYSIYRGILEDKIVYLNIPLSEDDNQIAESEYKLLQTLDHPLIPKPLDIVKINNLSSIIYENNGIDFETFMKEYGPIDEFHIGWIIERLLNVVGYLHSNKIVHNNIKPENLSFIPDSHTVVLLDYSLAINKANENASTYQIINEDYSPPYVNKNAKVIPNSDIYAIGKIAIKLLGGDVKSNGMPININEKIRNFIRKLVDVRISQIQNDAYALWDELIKIREELYGQKTFKKLNKKERRGF